MHVPNPPNATVLAFARVFKACSRVGPDATGVLFVNRQCQRGTRRPMLAQPRWKGKKCLAPDATTLMTKIHAHGADHGHTRSGPSGRAVSALEHQEADCFVGPQQRQSSDILVLFMPKRRHGALNGSSELDLLRVDVESKHLASKNIFERPPRLKLKSLGHGGVVFARPAVSCPLERKVRRHSRCVSAHTPRQRRALHSRQFAPDSRMHRPANGPEARASALCHG